MKGKLHMSNIKKSTKLLKTFLDDNFKNLIEIGKKDAKYLSLA